MSNSGPNERNLHSTAAWAPSGPARHAAPADGQLFSVFPCEFGQYDILEKIGAGGMGAVYLARNRRLQREVAIKLLPDIYARDADAVARFERETALLGNLDHRHIVRAYDAGEVQDIPYLAMEYVSGLDLAVLVQRLRLVPVADAAELVRQAAIGLQYAHEQGLVHRDIKPSNLLLSWDGIVKVADLGLACWSRQQQPVNDQERQELTATGSFAGTVDFMAPEQAADVRRVDTRADVYSLGCTLFKLLTGAPPFAGPGYESVGSKLVAHATVIAPDLRAFDPQIPPEMALLVQSMLAKKPADRPGTPGEVAQRLMPFAAAHNLKELIHQAQRASGVPLPPTTVRSQRSTTQITRVVATLLARPYKSVWLAGSLVFLVAVGAIIFSTQQGLFEKRQQKDMTAENVAVPLISPPAESKPKSGKDAIPSVATAPVSIPHDQAPLPSPLDRKFRPLMWHNLLDRSPHELLWYRDAGVASWHYDPPLEQLLVSCNDVGLLQLANVEASHYRYQVSIRQNNWSGGVGIFWGFHHTLVDGKSSPRFQQLILLPYMPENPEKAFSIQRTLCTLVELKPGTNFVQQEPLAAEVIPRPILPEISLDIAINNGMLTKVMWDGAELSKLVLPETHIKTTPEDYIGPLGTLNKTGDCVFRNARMIVHEERPTK